MKKRILVLDDNQDILDAVKEVLAYEGFEVTCISEAAVLDEVIPKLKPDLILLDYKLMDGNGAVICSELKSAEETATYQLLFFQPIFIKMKISRY